MENLYTVYVLWDPRNGDIRYVGQTSQPARRLLGHQLGHGRAGHRRNWLKSLIAQGLCCEWAIVEEGLTLEQANEKERWWIAYARERGWPVTNITEGGDGSIGCHPSPATRAKIGAASAKSHTGRTLPLETRAKIRAATMGNKNLLGHYPTPETKAKMSAGMKAAWRRRKDRLKGR